jgi:hypothetical protein
MTDDENTNALYIGAQIAAILLRSHPNRAAEASNDMARQLAGLAQSDPQHAVAALTSTLLILTKTFHELNGGPITNTLVERLLEGANLGLLDMSLNDTTEDDT